MILIYEDHHVTTGICSIHVLRRVPVPLMVSLNFLWNDHCQWQYHNYYSSYRQKNRLIITSSDDWGVIKINMTANFNKCIAEAKLFPYRKWQDNYHNLPFLECINRPSLVKQWFISKHKRVEFKFINSYFSESINKKLLAQQYWEHNFVLHVQKQQCDEIISLHANYWLTVFMYREKWYTWSPK